MGVFSTPIAAGLARAALVVVGVGGLTAGAVFAYQTTQGGDNGGAAGQAEVTSSPTVLATSTQPAPPTTAAPPTAEPTQAPTATSEPTVPPAPTSLVPPQDCGKFTQTRLDAERLGAQMEGALATQIDDDTVRVQFDATEAVVSVQGDVIDIRGDLTNDQLDRLSLAIDAVLYGC